MFQHGTNFADGPVGVSQCPIIPGNTFLYEFSVPDQAGTFWYHSHHSKHHFIFLGELIKVICCAETQYCDGLRGPLVIYDPNDPFKSWCVSAFWSQPTILTDNVCIEVMILMTVRFVSPMIFTPFNVNLYYPEHTIITLADWYYFFFHSLLH